MSETLVPYAGPELRIIAGRAFIVAGGSAAVGMSDVADHAPVTANEIKEAFPRGWPFGNEKGKPLHEVSERSMEWYIDQYQPKPGKYFEADQARKNLVARYLAAMKKGMATQDDPPPPFPPLEQAQTVTETTTEDAPF